MVLHTIGQKQAGFREVHPWNGQIIVLSGCETDGGCKGDDRDERVIRVRVVK